MKLTIRFGQEEDGRWLAVIDALPGVMAYGQTMEDTATQAQALAFWRLADTLEAGELASADHVEFERAA